MVAEYVAKITGDTSGLEKALKSAKGSMKQLSDDEVLIKLNYDGNVKDFNAEFDKILKSCPDLTIQFQYNVNQKMLNKELDKLKSLQELKLDIDTKNVDSKIKSMISSLDDSIGMDDPKETIENKIKSIYKYVNTAKALGAKIKTNIDDEIADVVIGTDYEKVFDKLFDNFDLSKLKLFNIKKPLDDEITACEKRVDDFKEHLSSLEKSGASKTGVSSELQSVQDEIKILKSDISDLQNSLGNLSGEKFQEITSQIKEMNSQLQIAVNKIATLTGENKLGAVVEEWQRQPITKTNERYTAFNSKTLETSGEHSAAGATGIAESLIRSAIKEMGEDADGFIHSHPEKYAAFSDADIEAYFKLASEGITKQIVTSFDEALSLDMSSVNAGLKDEILENIRDRYNKIEHEEVFEQPVYNFLDELKNVAPNVFSGLKSIPSDVLENFKNRYTNFLSSITESTSIDDYYDGLEDVIKGAMSESNSFKSANNELKASISSQLLNATNPLQAPLDDYCKNFVQQGFQNVLLDVFSNPKFLNDGVTSAISLTNISKFIDKNKLVNAGRSIGESVVEGLREGLDSHSPSKETESVADDEVDGFLNEATNRINEFHDVGKKQGEQVVEGISEGIKTVSGSEISDKLKGYIQKYIDLTKIVKSGDRFLTDTYDGDWSRVSTGVYSSDIRKGRTTKASIKRQLEEYNNIKSELETGKDKYGYDTIKGTEKNLKAQLKLLASYVYSFHDAEEAAKLFGKANQDVFNEVQDYIDRAIKSSEAYEERDVYDSLIHNSLSDYGISSMKFGQSDALMKSIESGGYEAFAEKLKELFGIEIPNKAAEGFGEVKKEIQDVANNIENLINKPIIHKLNGKEISKEAYSVLEKLRTGGDVSEKELSDIPEVIEANRIVEKAKKDLAHKYIYTGKIIEETADIHTKEREALREYILKLREEAGSFSGKDKDGNDVYTGEVAKNHKAVIVTGLPAAGKSSSLVNPLSQYYKAKVPDSDIIKTMLPEYNNGWGASIVHSESTKLNRELIERITDGSNLILPIVGNTVDKISAYIETLKEKGYEIEIVTNQVSNNEALDRNFNRFFNDGRFIDPRLIKGFGNSPTTEFEKIWNETLNSDKWKNKGVTGLARYSNSVPKNERPILLDSNNIEKALLDHLNKPQNIETVSSDFNVIKDVERVNELLNERQSILEKLSNIDDISAYNIDLNNLKHYSDNKFKELKLYHGSNKDFDKFDPSMMSDESLFGKGAYFTFNREDAETYGYQVSQWFANINKVYEEESKLSEEELKQIFDEYNKQIKYIWGDNFSLDDFINEIKNDKNSLKTIAEDIFDSSEEEVLKKFNYQARIFDLIESQNGGKGIVVFDVDNLERADKLLNENNLLSDSDGTSDIGLTYDQLIKKIQLENEEIAKGNREFKERLILLNEQGEVIASWQGTEHRVETDGTIQGAKKIIHTHPAYPGGSMLSSGDYLELLKEVANNGAKELELIWNDTISKFSFDGIDDSKLKELFELLSEAEHAANFMFGEDIPDSGKFAFTDIDQLKDAEQLVKNITSLLFKQYGGEVSWGSEFKELSPERLQTILSLMQKIHSNRSNHIISENENEYLEETYQILLKIQNSSEQNETSYTDDTKSTLEELESAVLKSKKTIDATVDSEIQKFKELGDVFSYEIPYDISFKNDAIKQEGEIVNETVDQEISKFRELKGVLSGEIPSAIDEKNNAIRSGANTEVITNAPINQDVEPVFNDAFVNSLKSVRSEIDLTEATLHNLFLTWNEFNSVSKDTHIPATISDSSKHTNYKVVSKNNKKDSTVKLYEETSGQLSLFKESITAKNKDLDVTSDLAKAQENLNNVILEGQITMDEYVDSIKTNAETSAAATRAWVEGLEEVKSTTEKIQSTHWDDSESGVDLLSREFGKIYEYQNKFGVLSKSVDELISKASKLQGLNLVPESASQVDKLVNELNILKGNISNASYEPKSLNSVIERYKELGDVLNKLSKDSKSNIQATETSMAKLSLKIQDVILSTKSSSNTPTEALNKLKAFIEELSTGSVISVKRLKEIDSEFRRITGDIKNAGGYTKSFFDIVGQKAKYISADFLARYLSLQDIIRYGRQAYETVKDLNDALIEMRKVSDNSVEELMRYQKRTFDVAGEIGSTSLALQNATADWMRLGESLDQAAESAKTATILLNVSEFENINDATQSLVSASQAYKELDKIDIVDKLNNIGNNYSISTDQLAQGLQNAAAVMKTQGNDIDQAIALLTAGNSITQDISKTSAKTLAGICGNIYPFNTFNCVDYLKLYATI